MSKRKSHTDFLPVLWARYESPRFAGIIFHVEPRRTSANGKEFISFQVAVAEVFTEDFTQEVGDLVWQMATPTHRLNGQFNVMRNANEK